jgi:hypothetical protein
MRTEVLLCMAYILQDDRKLLIKVNGDKYNAAG